MFLTHSIFKHGLHLLGELKAISKLHSSIQITQISFHFASHLWCTPKPILHYTVLPYEMASVHRWDRLDGQEYCLNAGWNWADDN